MCSATGTLGAARGAAMWGLRESKWAKAIYRTSRNLDGLPQTDEADVVIAGSGPRVCSRLYGEAPRNYLRLGLSEGMNAGLSCNRRRGYVDLHGFIQKPTAC